MMMNNFSEIIRNKQKIGVACHTFPDGDALGSVHAMVLALRKIGKAAYILSKDKVLDSLNFLPLTRETNEADDVVKDGTDLIIVLDCGSFDRVSYNYRTNVRFEVMNIDHHRSNDKFGDYNFIAPKASSTGEMVYGILKKAGIQRDQAIDTCLYTAITTDTGSFRFECTTPETHRIAAELIASGIPFQEIARSVFDEKPLARIKLMGRAIDSLETYFDGRVNLMRLKDSDFTDLKIIDKDTSELVNLGLAPMEAEVSMILKETEGKIRVSVRTKQKVDAGRYAEVFQGGGHIRAAGLTLMTPSFEEAKDMLLRELEAYLY